MQQPLIPLIIVVLFATFCKGHDEEHMYYYLGAMINHYNLLEKCYGQESIGKVRYFYRDSSILKLILFGIKNQNF